MVKSIFSALVLACLAGNCLAQAGCSKASEFQPVLCPFKLPRITGLTITENGARSSQGAEPGLDCSRFKLGSDQVRRYFSRARQIREPGDSHHTLDWLPCYASGSMQLANGKTATWVIEQSQTGRVMVQGEPDLHLYCRPCKFAPFLW